MAVDPDWDLDLWRALAATVDGPILELGCGDGRVLAALQQAGHDVLGVELDPTLAARAADRVGAERVRCGDLATLALPVPAALVLAPCNSLSLDRDPGAWLRAARRNLRTGGLFAFDLVVPGGRPWGQPPFTWSRDGEGGRYDPETGEHRGWSLVAGQRRVESTWYRPLTEWDGLLAAAGLTLLRWVDERGTTARETSLLAVCVARRLP